MGDNNILGDNIRQRRRDKGVTQEQLAQALGVSTGAVSKWESGISNPEIPMLMSVAEFFGASTDALLGYRCTTSGPDEAVEKIKRFTTEKRLDDAINEAIRALGRYPNSFSVLYHSAKAYDMAGLVRGDRELMERAGELYRRSAGLIDQNTDREISYEGLQIHIGMLYSHMGEQKKAIEQLGKYNFLGINDADIGHILTTMGKYKEAMPYLSDNLVRCVTNLYMGSLGMVTCFAESGETALAAELCEWLYHTLSGLCESGGSYLDKLNVLVLAVCAYVCADDREKARGYLRLAKQTAERFDKHPVFGCNSIKYYRTENHAFYDDIGESATESITRMISEQDDDAKKKIIFELWEEIRNEK